MTANGGAEPDGSIADLLIYTLLAATFDAVSDTISDEVVGDEGNASPPRPARKTRSPIGSQSSCPSTQRNSPTPLKSPSRGSKSRSGGKLTGEQDFIVSTTLSLFVSGWIAINSASGPGGFLPPANLLGTQLAVLAGLVYSVASVYCMKAWERMPSGVVVPLMQLTSPIVEIMGYVLGSFHGSHIALEPFRTSMVGPVEFVAFVFIFAGAMVPSLTMGNLFSASADDRKRLLLNRDVLMLLWADVLFALYILLLTAGTSMPEQGIKNTQFVVVSNISAFVWTMLSCLVLPDMTKAIHTLDQASTWSLKLCSISELANYLAILSFATAMHAYPNEGLVTAARSALHQLENFLLGEILYRLFKFGRRPQGWRSKAVSAVLVCIGLGIASCLQ